MITVDAMGKPCPIPVIEAKKAMAQLPAQGGEILVLVDNEVACQNLEKMAAGNGAACQWTKVAEAAYQVTLTVGERDAASTPTVAPASAPVQPAGSSNLVVAVGSRHMGDGSEDLGKILIKGFLYSLGELEELPTAILFYNSGAYLTIAESSSLADLKAMESKGVRICTCGTCADYYHLKEQVAVGSIVNMYDIVGTMAAAGRVIRP